MAGGVEGQEGEEGEYGLCQKREPVKALILNTWVTSQYLDALTRASDISPPGLAREARDMRHEGGWSR